MLSPSSVDMTTLASVKSWNSIGNTAEDVKLQSIITALSTEFLLLTGRGDPNPQSTSLNPFVQPVDYVEVCDGNGNDRMFLRNMPINTLTSVSLGGASLPLADAFGKRGVSIDSKLNCISIANSGGGCGYGSRLGYVGGRFGGQRGGGFPIGTQNIQVDYNAGYTTRNIAGELQTIPATAVPGNGSTPAIVPLVIITSALLAGYGLIVDVGVSYFSNGVPLTRALVAPSAGKYYIQADNSYLFNVADAGREVLLSYEAAGTPPDIVTAMNQWVGLNRVQSNPARMGIRSLAMKDVGSTTYSTYVMDPSVKMVVSNYSRQTI